MDSAAFRNRISILFVFLALLTGLAGAEEVKLEKGLEIEVEDVNHHMMMGQNYTLNISQIIEYNRTLQLGKRNLSVYAEPDGSTYPRVNTTLFEYRPDPPYSDGEKVIQLQVSFNQDRKVNFHFEGFRSLETGSYVLKHDGSRIKDFGQQGTFSWQNSSWSTKNYSVECESSGDCTGSEDTTSPSVSVSHSPSSPDKSDEVTVTADASDTGTGLDRIEVYIDGELNRTCSSSPCSTTVGPFSSGSTHSYKAKAFDNAGNSASDSGSFTVESTNNNQNQQKEDSQSGGGDSGGGGGFSISNGSEISVSRAEISLKAEPGGSDTESFQITNSGGEAAEVQLEVKKLSDVVQVSPSVLTVQPGETRQVSVRTSPDSSDVPGGYSGKISLSHGGSEKQVSVYLVIQSREKEVEAGIELAEDIFDFRERPEFTVLAYNLGEGERKVDLRTTIKNQNGDVVYSSSRSNVPVGEVETIHRQLSRQLPKGDYEIRVSAETAGDTSVSAARFSVEDVPETLPSRFLGFQTKKILTFFAVLAFLATLQAFFYFYKWRKLDRGSSEAVEQDAAAAGTDAGGSGEPQPSQTGAVQSADIEQMSEDEIRQRIDEIEQQGAELEERRKDLEKEYKSGGLTRQEYRDSVQEIEQKEKQLYREIEELEDQL